MTPLLCAFALLASDAWILFHSEENVTMSGDLSDLPAAQRLYKKFGPHYLWFRLAGKSYVISDGKVLQQADATAASDRKVDAKEKELDAADAELDRQQEKLDRSEAQIDAWQDSGARDPKLHDARAQVSRAQREVGREQERVGKEQEKLGKVQEAQSKKMEQKMAELIAAALRDGTAKEVR